MKTVERAQMPSKLWEIIPLDANYEKALATIDDRLAYWNKFVVHKCKQRLTKLTEMLRRMRRLKIKGSQQMQTIRQKTERRDLARLEKAEQRAMVDTGIEQELLDRLKMGTYGELYDDLVNLNRGAFDKLVNEKEKDELSEDLSFDSQELEVLLEAG